MTQWDLLWWMLPMKLVGGLFRRHVLKQVPWEVEKNLLRLISDWNGVTESALSELRVQAQAWIESELATLERLLKSQPDASRSIRWDLQQLEQLPATIGIT